MSKNTRNIRYAIITLAGFIIDTDTGGMKTFHTAELAARSGLMKPGNQIVPIKDEEQQADYESGKVRPPSVNRAGLRDNVIRMPGQRR